MEIEETSDEDEELMEKQNAGVGADEEKKPQAEQAEPDEKPLHETAKELEKTSEKLQIEEKEKQEETAAEEETAQEPVEGEEMPKDSNKGEEDQVVENADDHPGDGENEGEVNNAMCNVKSICNIYKLSQRESDLIATFCFLPGPPALHVLIMANVLFISAAIFILTSTGGTLFLPLC